MTRILKYYTWEYENGMVYLVCKKEGHQQVMKLSMAMADSFVRAYISFKTHQKIDERNAIHVRLNKKLDAKDVRIQKLVEMIGKLRNKKQLVLV